MLIVEEVRKGRCRLWNWKVVIVLRFVATRNASVLGYRIGIDSFPRRHTFRFHCFGHARIQILVKGVLLCHSDAYPLRLNDSITLYFLSTLL